MGRGDESTRDWISATLDALMESKSPPEAPSSVTAGDPSAELAWLTDRFLPFLERSRQLNEQNERLHEEIAERIRIEDELERTRRTTEAASQAKSEFLANMSHELHTPLNGVVGMAQSLLATQLDPEQREMAAIIHESGLHQLQVVNDILDFSSLEAGGLRLNAVIFDLRAVAELVLKLLSADADAKGLELRLQCDPQLPASVLGDRGRIRRILANLVGNAVRFTTDGSVTLVLEVVESDSAWDRIRASVVDTGPGIPPEMHETIFESFTQVDGSLTRTHGGTGLGLSISKLLAELMNGSVGVASALGQGSRFWLELPLAKVQPEPATQDPHSAPAIAAKHTPQHPSKQATQAPQFPHPRAGKNLSVLVVEDNPINMRVAQLQLQKLGCRVTTAEHGAEAVALLREQAFDLVFMDCQMPVMDGYAATKAIRELPVPHANLPIIALTAHARAADRQRCLDSGMNDHVSKPAPQGALAKILQQWAAAAGAVD